MGEGDYLDVAEKTYYLFVGICPQIGVRPLSSFKFLRKFSLCYVHMFSSLLMDLVVNRYMIFKSSTDCKYSNANEWKMFLLNYIFVLLIFCS
jgi:hypothetical protein